MLLKMLQTAFAGSSARRLPSRAWRRKLVLESLEIRRVLDGSAAATASTSSPWENPLDPADVNGDGSVTPLDALVCINAINAGQTGSLSGQIAPASLQGIAQTSTTNFPDCTGDGSLSPLDALMVINKLNSSDHSPPPFQLPPTNPASSGTVGGDAPQLVLHHGFVSVHGNIATTGQQDVYSIVPTADDLNASLITPSSTPLAVSIEDAAGNVLATATTTDAGPKGRASADASVTPGTTYYIVVSGGAEGAGKYALQAMNYAEGDYPKAPPPPQGNSGGQTPPTGGNQNPTAPPTPEQIFAKVDTDQSGDLTLTEFKAGLQYILPPPPGGSGSGGQSSPTNGPPNGSGSSNKPSPEQLFAKLDADSNGLVTLAEFKAGLPGILPPVGNQP